MTTFGDVVDRIYRDWLHGPDEQPVVAPLSTATNMTQTGIQVQLVGLTQDELALIAPGTILEIGYEQMLVSSAETNGDMVVIRGWNDTDMTTHLDGDTVTFVPSWGRQTVLDAVCDEVPRLSPALTASVSSTLTTGAWFTEVPANVTSIESAWTQSGAGYRQVRVESLMDFPPSSTGRAIRTPGVAAGSTVYLSHRAALARPSAPTDTLADFSVDEDWIPILMVGSVASLLASEDVDRVSVDFITELLEAEQFTVGTSQRLRDSMLSYREYLLAQARQQQLSTSVTTTVRRHPTYQGV